MKKLVILSLLALPLMVYASEEISLEGFVEPQWKDFAPVAYVNVTEPKGFAKFNDVLSYWYKRKVAFDNDIAVCRATEPAEDKIACYQALKIKQYQKNSDYNARIEAMERERMNPQAIQDTTTNMYPIGGLLENFGRYQPNELH